MKAAGFDRDRYYSAGLDQSEEKSEIRLRVAQFIAENHEDGRRNVCLSLPGLNWEFEKTLIDMRPDIKIFGVEEDFGIFEKGKLLMPGSGPPIYSEAEMNFGKIPYYMTDKAKFMNLDLEAILGLELADSRGPKVKNRPVGVLSKQKKKWARFRKQLGLWTSCWLDFYSSVEVIPPIIKRLDRMTNMKINRAPFAITFYVGRESNNTMKYINIFNHLESPAERRAMLLAATLDKSRHRRFEYVETLNYKSMGVLLGFSILR